jgi:beta-N-acetylhexosaminidase
VQIELHEGARGDDVVKKVLIWRRCGARLTLALCALLSGCAPPTASSPSPASAQPTMTPGATAKLCDERSLLGAWPVERLAQQTIVVPVNEGDVGSVRSEVAAGTGGVILFGSSAPANLGAVIQALKATAPGGIAPFVMTDEEGGAVQRMANLVGEVPSARQMAATLAARQIQLLAASLGSRLRAAGVTVDLAPVLDLDAGPGPNDVDADGTRSFSAVEPIAAADGLAFATGLQAGGVFPVVKHFPGLGGATANTDVRPASTKPWSELQQSGLLPFATAAQAELPAVMVANASVPGLSNLPASISSAVIGDVLRGKLGFHGLVLTDSLSAGALADAGYSVPQASVAALRAGADMVLFTADPKQVAAVSSSIVGAIAVAVMSGQLNRDQLVGAVQHVLAAKNINPCATG